METICEYYKEGIEKAFDEVKNCSVIDSLILKSKTFKIIQEKDLSGIK